MVFIHLFPNGDGRHARLATDVLLTKQLNQPRFTWGQGLLIEAGEVRKHYIQALQEADRGRYKALIDFVRK